MRKTQTEHTEPDNRRERHEAASTWAHSEVKARTNRGRMQEKENGLTTSSDTPVCEQVGSQAFLLHLALHDLCVRMKKPTS